MRGLYSQKKEYIFTICIQLCVWEFVAGSSELQLLTLSKKELIMLIFVIVYIIIISINK